MAHSSLEMGLNLGMRAAETAQRRGESEKDRKMRKLMAAEERGHRESMAESTRKHQTGMAQDQRKWQANQTVLGQAHDLQRDLAGYANQKEISQENLDAVNKRHGLSLKSAKELQSASLAMQDYLQGQRLSADQQKHLDSMKFSYAKLKQTQSQFDQSNAIQAALLPPRIAALEAQTAATTAALNPQQTWQKNAGDGVRNSSADLRAAGQGFMAAKMNPLSTPEQLAQAEENEKLAAGAYKQAVQHAQRGFEATRPKVQYGTKSVFNSDTGLFEDRPFTNYTGSPEDEERWRQLRMPRTSPAAPPAQTGGTGYTPLPPALPVIPDPDKPDSQGLFGR